MVDRGVSGSRFEMFPNPIAVEYLRHRQMLQHPELFHCRGDSKLHPRLGDRRIANWSHSGSSSPAAA